MSKISRENRSFMNFEGWSSVMTYAGVLMACLAVMSLASGCKTSGPTQSSQSGVRNGRTEYVKAHSLNLRSAPSTKASVLGVLKKGERVVIRDRKGDWIKVGRERNHPEGWVYGAYLTGFSIAAPTKSKPAKEKISTKKTTPAAPKPAEEQMSKKETTPVTPEPAEEQISTKETIPVDDASVEEETPEIGGKITTIAEEEPAPAQPSEQPDELESLSPKETQPME